MSRLYVNQLSDGDELDAVLQVREKQLRSNRHGNLYLSLDLGDRTGTINARYWNVTEEQAKGFDAGDFLHVQGKVQLFQGHLQMILTKFNCQQRDQVDLSEFLPSTEKNIDELLADLRQLLGSIKDPSLQALSQAFLMDKELLDAYCRAPAGIRHHHAYVGGLLEHVVCMLKVVDRIADLYPNLNRDLLVMGVFLHDIGKVRELTFAHHFNYTDEGQLVGHIVSGIELVQEKSAVVEQMMGQPIPDDTLRLVKHLILSHHGSIEHGAVKVPMIPEAVALHHLDNFDAKVNSFTSLIRDDPDPEAAWTPFDHLNGCRIFKHSNPQLNGTTAN